MTVGPIVRGVPLTTFVRDLANQLMCGLFSNPISSITPSSAHATRVDGSESSVSFGKRASLDSIRYNDESKLVLVL